MTQSRELFFSTLISQGIKYLNSTIYSASLARCHATFLEWQSAEK